MTIELRLGSYRACRENDYKYSTVVVIIFSAHPVSRLVKLVHNGCTSKQTIYYNFFTAEQSILEDHNINHQRYEFCILQSFSIPSFSHFYKD